MQFYVWLCERRWINRKRISLSRGDSAIAELLVYFIIQNEFINNTPVLQWLQCQQSHQWLTISGLHFYQLFFINFIYISINSIYFSRPGYALPVRMWSLNRRHRWAYGADRVQMLQVSRLAVGCTAAAEDDSGDHDDDDNDDVHPQHAEVSGN